MQTTKPIGMDVDEAQKLGRLREELFTAKSEGRLTRQMDKRMRKLERGGEELVSRRQIPPEQIPAEVSRLAALAAAAHNRGQKRRLKKMAQKLIAAL